MTNPAPLSLFRDVPVVPVQSVAQHVTWGGPIWPDFDHQVAPRHCRDRLPVDRCPATPTARGAPVDVALWGGYLNPQFGHLIVEQVTRLPQSLAEGGTDPVLFTLPPGGTAASVPGWVWQVLDWHGLPRDRVRLVDQPLQVGALRVAPQGEMMGTHRTAEGYLDRLDTNTARQSLTPDAAPVVFVTRAGLVARGQGGHAGEGYLADALRRAGVRVVDPAQWPVRRQLEIYAGARVLVFSEGSALQGRMLLGRVAQDIHVLRRRPNRDLAAEQLGPRCDRLHYYAAVKHRLGARMPGGANRLDMTAAITDLDVVLGLFASLGHDARPHWDAAAYRAAILDDLRGWFSHCRTAPDQVLANLAMLAQAGFSLDAPFTPAPRAADRPAHAHSG